jgi:hypothetical protein
MFQFFLKKTFQFYKNNRYKGERTLYELLEEGRKVENFANFSTFFRNFFYFFFFKKIFFFFFQNSLKILLSFLLFYLLLINLINNKDLFLYL